MFEKIPVFYDYSSREKLTKVSVNRSFYCFAWLKALVQALGTQ